MSERLNLKRENWVPIHRQTTSASSYFWLGPGPDLSGMAYISSKTESLHTDQKYGTSGASLHDRISAIKDAAVQQSQLCTCIYKILCVLASHMLLSDAWYLLLYPIVPLLLCQGRGVLMLAETQLRFAIAKAACALASGNMNRFNEQTTKMVLSKDLKKKNLSFLTGTWLIISAITWNCTWSVIVLQLKTFGAVIINTQGN